MVTDREEKAESAFAPTALEGRLRAIETVLTTNGHVESAKLGAFVEVFESRIGPDAGTDITPGTPAEPDQPAAQVGAHAMLAIPRDAEGPVFRERWEVVTFALALMLAERGAFDWGEWAETLGQQIKRLSISGEREQNPTYYRLWLAALEQIIAHKGLAEARS